MRSFIYILTAFLYVALFSCKSKIDYTAEIMQLDSSLTQLESCGSNFTGIDTLRVKNIFDSVSAPMKLLEKNIAGDTLPKSLAEEINDVYRVQNDLSNFIHNQHMLKRAWIENKNRISDLKHDLEASLIEKKIGQDYVFNEIRASSRICQTMSESASKANEALTLLDTKLSRLKFLSDSLSPR